MRVFPVAYPAALLLLASSSLFAQVPGRPAPPQVTVGANLKELTFDWDPVPGAFTYRLLEKLGEGTYFTAVGNRIPASRTQTGHPVAVHLQNWNSTRYAVQACNEAGCTRSAEVFPQHLMLDTIGYLKASNNNAGDRFGRVLAMSSDGSTLAVTADRESSNATGVNGNQASNTSSRSGAVYVFRRTGRSWAQEAYLKAGVNQPFQSFGTGSPIDLRPMALSEDGSLLAIGTPGQDLPGADNAGVVYLFSRATDGSWSLATTLQAPAPAANDHFGFSVDMSLDGRTLKVSSRLPVDGEGNPEGRTHIFVRPDNTWQHDVTLAPYYPGDHCPTVRMSTNGRTLVAACFAQFEFEARAITLQLLGDAWVQVSELPLPRAFHKHPVAISHHGTKLALHEFDRIGMFRWENGAWLREVDLLRPHYESIASSGHWGQALEFDKAGDYFVIGNRRAPLAGAGVMEVATSGTEQHGVAFLLEYRGPVSHWVYSRIVKAPNPGVDDMFGDAVALSGNGRILAIGAFGEDSAARGVDGNQLDETAESAGAVYLY